MAYRSVDNSKAAAKEPRTSDKLQKLCHRNPLLNLLGTVSGVGESPPPPSVTAGITHWGAASCILQTVSFKTYKRDFNPSHPGHPGSFLFLLPGKPFFFPTRCPPVFPSLFMWHPLSWVRAACMRAGGRLFTRTWMTYCWVQCSRKTHFSPVNTGCQWCLKEG